MQLETIIAVSRAARRMGADFPGYLSTGEACCAALVLNRADYLKELGRTMAEAIARLDPGDADMLLDAQHALQIEAPFVGEG